ncbi:hypothetical protein ACS5PN_27035 [Roseateles sp. NT4]|uniref:hypothetical protein n=1 Tax=Roseateles sp. NT4 TaxID=3453715 RepID=UPI003EEA18E5
MTDMREALIAEALGDMAALLSRLETVKPIVEAACHDLTMAAETLGDRAARAEERVAAVADGAAVRAVKHVARRADELIKRASEDETRAMQAAAREIFKRELGQALQRSLASTKRRSFVWWTHVATAVVVGSLAWAVAIYVFLR